MRTVELSLQEIFNVTGANKENGCYCVCTSRKESDQNNQMKALSQGKEVYTLDYNYHASEVHYEVKDLKECNTKCNRFGPNVQAACK